MEREVRKDAAVPMEDLTYDFSMLRMLQERGQDKQQVMIVNVNRDMVYEKIGVLRTFGIVPAAIATLSGSLYSLLERNSLWRIPEAVGLIEIGATISTLFILGNETLYFQREIFTGYVDMKKAFEEGEEEGEMDFGPGVVGGPSSIEEIPALQRVATELKRSFLYYKQQFRGNIIKNVYVCGEGVRLPRIDEFLAEGLEDVEIKYFNPLEGVNLDALGATAAELETLGPRFPGCIGMAITPPKEARINLLPSEIKAQQYMAIKRVVYAAIVVLVLGLITLAYWWMNDKLKDAKNLYEREVVIYDGLKPDLNELKAVNTEIGRYQSYSDLLAKLTKTEPLWADVFANLGSQISDNMYIQSIDVRREGEGPSSRRGRGRNRGARQMSISEARWEVEFEGYAYDDSQVALQERISRFQRRLDESPFFDSVYLQPDKEPITRVEASRPYVGASKGGEERLLNALTTIYSDIVPGTYKKEFRIICKLEGQQFWEAVRRRG